MTAETVPALDVAEVIGVEWWAIRTTLTPLPRHAARGCPATGWIHEGNPPWRVLVARDPFRLPFNVGERVPYTGSEATITIDQWLAGR